MQPARSARRLAPVAASRKVQGSLSSELRSIGTAVTQESPGPSSHSQREATSGASRGVSSVAGERRRNARGPQRSRQRPRARATGNRRRSSAAAAVAVPSRYMPQERDVAIGAMTASNIQSIGPDIFPRESCDVHDRFPGVRYGQRQFPGVRCASAALSRCVAVAHVGTAEPRRDSPPHASALPPRSAQPASSRPTSSASSMTSTPCLAAASSLVLPVFSPATR